MFKKFFLDFKKITILIQIFLLSACACSPKIQPLVENLASANNYERALKLLEEKKDTYGKNNELLYLLDKSFIQHLAGRFDESIETFDKTRQKFDELYTKSVVKIVNTWIFNDYSASYRGEDFEQVLVNIFQALNYFKIGKLEDALVEARDVDSKLNAINNQYKAGEKNVYKEDAFARFLMGIIYEAGKSREDINDAFISYRKAEEIYTGDYAKNYNLPCPDILKENILAVSRYLGFAEFGLYREKFKTAGFFPLDEKRKKSEVYLIQYNGLSPVKIEESVPVPLPDGYVLKFAFAKYKARPYGIYSSRLLARNSRGEVFKIDTELAEDIGAIAEKNLENRKLRFVAKTIARSSARYLVEKKQEENITKKQGNIAGAWFKFFSNMYNIMVEQADLRCWQTLPDQIRIARIILEPGEYEFSLENFNENGELLDQVKLQRLSLKAGEKNFLLCRSAR